MSLLSTRSGRMVKRKQKADAEYINGSNVKIAKSLSSPNKDKASRRNTADIQSPVNPDSLVYCERIIKDDPDKNTSSSSSSAKERVPIPEESAAVTIIEYRDNEVKKVELVSPVVVKTENDGRETPVSTVRRSGRAPVPSSKFKDMELDLARSKKRLHTEMETHEPERAKKNRKISDKSATETGIEVNKPTQSETNAPSEIQIPTVVLDNVNRMGNENEQSHLIEADLHKETEGMKHNTELLEVHIIDTSEQPTVQDSSSSGLHTTKLSLNSNGEEDVNAVYPSIKIGGQQLTFSEHDGETVAVVTISSSPLKDEIRQGLISMDSITQEQGVSLEVVDSEQGKKSYSDLMTVKPTIHSSGQVIRRDFVETPFATVIGHDGATYLNLSVEATKISSILKGKHLTTSAKSNNPLKGHGRVLRSPVGNMILKTTLVPPRVTQQEDVKPTVTYSLLGSKKPQTGESIYSAPKTVALPASVISSHVSQSPQTIVIRQKMPQKTPILTSVPQVITTHDENMMTLINVSQDLPAYGVTSACSADNCNDTVSPMPKTASEILHKLKIQPHLVKIESTQTVERSTQEPSSNVNDTEAVGAMDEMQASQQDVSDCGMQPDVSQISHNGSDEVIVESHDVVVVDGSESKAVEINTSELCVSMDAQNNKLSTDLNADIVLGESSQAATEQHMAAQSIDQTPAPSLLGSTDIPEESLVISTSDDLPEVSASSSILPVHSIVDSKEMQTSTSSESPSVLTEITSVEQNALTVRSNLSSAANNLMPEVPGTRKQFIEKVTVVEGGVEYEMRIVSEEEVTEEIIDNAAAQILQIKQSADNTVEVEPQIKQEVDDDTEETKPEIEKQSSSTQTVYSPKIESTSVAGTNATTTHTLTTVVDDGSEKKHVYYVSVIPNKGIMAKTKTSMYSSAASWVINDNGMYCCEKCDYQTDRKANFYKHRKSHTGAKPHMCGVCQYKAGTSSNLKRHMGIHKDIREHKCDICSLCFRQKIHLERHIKYKHEEKSIKCPLCDYICANEQPDLKMHIKRKHSNENSGEMVTCPECNIQVGNRKDLKQHLKFHRDGPELKLFCKECSFVTDCQSRLKRHTAIHSKMKPFSCAFCNYRAAQKEHVMRHLRTQHKMDIKKDGKRPWRRHKRGIAEDGSKERADFTSGDKIFACNHCTMRFAKLINLYKHLHTQHGDIMPAETGGNFYCVVCEFSTTNKKNLLVHMRRHNMTDQTPPTHVYSCMMCRYVNPRQRNLFQHMRKKHNISIGRQTDGMDGEDNGDGQELEIVDIIGAVNHAMAANGSTVSVSTSEMTENTSEMAGDLTSVASVIKIEDLTRMTGSGDNDGMQALVIDSRGGAEVAEVVHTSTHAAEALEGLQALAEQAGLIDNIIEEQVPVLDEQQTIVIEQNGTTTEIVGTVETVGHLQHLVHHSPDTLAGPGWDGTERLELSEDQLSSLRSGDVVEMEEQLYLVELTQDPSNPHKQVLSFLPVTTATVTQ
ncbi:hypothetical protein BsWGS_17896 [Bradybaena similaris]